MFFIYYVSKVIYVYLNNLNIRALIVLEETKSFQDILWSS